MEHVRKIIMRVMETIFAQMTAERPKTDLSCPEWSEDFEDCHQLHYDLYLAEYEPYDPYLNEVLE